MPPNEVEIKLIFTRRRSAKVMGKLAEAPVATDDDDDEENGDDNTEEEGRRHNKRASQPPREGEAVRGILVTQQNSSKIVSPEDLSTYTPLRAGSVSSRLHVPFVGRVGTLRMFLNEMFRGIEEEEEEEEVVDGEVDDDYDEGVVTFSMHGGQVSTYECDRIYAVCALRCVASICLAGSAHL